MEQLAGIGEEIHFCWSLVEPKTILLRKICNHLGGVWTHEFGIYHSQSNGLIYFHRCDKCMYAVRISEEYYRRAETISEQGGYYID